jgi:NADPH-dependent curcumin reductase CurA
MSNRRVLLVSRPTGVAQARHFAIEEVPSAPLGERQVRVRNRFLSVEPAMRGWIADQGNYSAPMEIGAVVRSLAAGEVSESSHPDYKRGEKVSGWFGWQEEAVVDESAIVRRILEDDLPISLSLGVLGINGITAHLALTLIGDPTPGDTVLVSTAAGAVGSAVGQIAHILGCRSVGIAGGPEKVAQCLDLFGYDAAIDYKNDDLASALDAACPRGMNVYFDNVSGSISDTVYPRLATGARVVVCGTTAYESWEPWPSGPRIERHLLVKRARAEGFVIFDHAARYEASIAKLADWIRSGQLRYAEDILAGIESCPDALAGLYRGENKGKRIIKL